jgi:hypothetical protein
VYTTLSDLLDALAGGRRWRLEPMGKSEESLSGSPFERAFIDGTPYVVKHIGRDLDWIMRVLGDGEGGDRPRALIVWAEGLLAALPAEIDPVIVGMAYNETTGRLIQVMRDVSAALVPGGAGVVPADQHRRFLDHMAGMHAAFWGFAGTPGLTTPRQRYRFADPAQADREAASGHDDPIPKLIPRGWVTVRALAPEVADAAVALAADPAPLVAAMADGPHTFVHGDWKYGNLGTLPDGRTVLLDWGWPGRAGPCVDLAWYLAVNCDRLPESKEDTIEAYRAALERHGVATAPWWDRHLDLALLGAFLQLGWSKAENPAELNWWADRCVVTARSLNDGVAGS